LFEIRLGIFYSKKIKAEMFELANLNVDLSAENLSLFLSKPN